MRNGSAGASPAVAAASRRRSRGASPRKEMKGYRSAMAFAARALRKSMGAAGEQRCAAPSQRERTETI
jgi:hypothetical protein